MEGQEGAGPHDTEYVAEVGAGCHLDILDDGPHPKSLYHLQLIKYHRVNLAGCGPKEEKVAG